MSRNRTPSGRKNRKPGLHPAYQAFYGNPDQPVSPPPAKPAAPDPEAKPVTADFDALLTKAQRDACADIFARQGVVYRVAVACLASSGPELVRVAAKDPKAFMNVLDAVSAHVDWLKANMKLVESAQARLLVAGGEGFGVDLEEVQP
ncbi:MAG: hypothetical protein KDI44_12895 [Thiothrix sp.]|nr:hypothetical protein [Thiothrix sp.]HPQ96950.1 hypothetical protein [Thiolinea sp.]